MKIISVLLLSVFSLLAFGEEFNRKDYMDDEMYLFSQVERGKILFFQKVTREGKDFASYPVWYIGLRDSFLNDQLFRKDAEAIPYYDDFSTFKNGSKLKDPYSMHMGWEPLFEDHQERYVFRWGWIHLSSHENTVLKKDELMGKNIYFWFLENWNIVEKEFNTQKRTLFLTPHVVLDEMYQKNLSSLKSYESVLQKGSIMEFDQADYRIISSLKNRLKTENKPYFSKNSPQSFEKLAKLDSFLHQSGLKLTDGRLPLLYIDQERHASRLDKNDWRIHTYLNHKNGDFFQYFTFEKELDYESPLFLREWALDYLCGVEQCKNSSIGILLDNKEKKIKQDSGIFQNTPNILFALTKENQSWKPQSVPADMSLVTTPTRRMFSDEPGGLFGSYSKVWELGIWERLGMMFKLNPKAEIYLCGYGTLLQAAETKTVEEEHALIKKCGVRMTAELYSELEKLRKSQK